eukprot:gene3867-15163_t
MSKERYNDLLRRLKEKLTFGKNHRFPTSADERLVLTLRYLAHGDAQQNLAITGRYIFGKRLNAGTLDLPAPSALPGSEQISPYVFVCDEAFQLKENMMRPYPRNNFKHGSELSDEKKVYNYRHSQARRISENAFGILSVRWRVVQLKPIQKNSVTITKACIALHNYLAKTDFQNTPKTRYVPPTLVDQELQGDVVPGTWREIQADSIRAINRVGSNMSSKQATKYRKI